MQLRGSLGSALGTWGRPCWTSGWEGVLPSLTELMDSRSQVRGTTIIIIVISIMIISVIVIVFVIAI